MNIGSTIFGQMRPRYVNLFGSDGGKCIWHEPVQDYHSEYVVLTVKYDGGSVMIRGCISAKGVVEMAFVNDTMNACGCTKLLADKMTHCLQKPGSRGIFQHANDPNILPKSSKSF